VERLDPKELNECTASYVEHSHRYEFASTLISGNVLDVACGLGYGAKIISKSNMVREYTGVDINGTAVAWAKRNVLCDLKPKFIQSSILDLPFFSGYFDAVVSFETLEHLDDPLKAICEIYRVLAPNGIFIGSVPTKYFEILCRETYGENIHHKQEFDKDTLLYLLSSCFDKVEFYLSRLGIFSFISKMQNAEQPQKKYRKIEEKPLDELGSYIFVAGKETTLDLLDKNRGTFSSKYYSTLVEYDKLKVIPQIKYISDLEGRSEELVKYISDLEGQSEEQVKYISDLEGQSEEQVKYISDLEGRSEELVKYISDLEGRSEEQVKYISDLEKVLSVFKRGS